MEDPILFWNNICNDANRVDHTAPMKGMAQGGPPRSARAAAMVHIAMHDAFFGVTAPATPLYLAGLAPPPYAGGNGLKFYSAAVSAAAQTVLATLYPEQAPDFQTAGFKIAEANETDGSAHDYGRNVAVALLNLRAGDGADKAYPKQTYAAAKRHHRADPLNAGAQGEPLDAHWGRVKPFAIQATHALAAPLPSNDPMYLQHSDEVRQKGGAASQPTTNRTIDETVSALYWAYDGAVKLGTPSRLYNQILQVIARDMNNSHADNAKLFALVNAAMGDAGIYAWHYKYVHDLWRPVIGIREYDANFGWDAVPGRNTGPHCDPFWRPLGAPKTNDLAPGARSFTPPFPAYPSGHATFGSAVFEMVRQFYKAKAPAQHTYGEDDEDNIGFSFISGELDGISTDNDGAIRTRHERKFTSLAQAMYENSLSRVFLGVHWRFDGTSGESIKQMLKRSVSGVSNDHIGGVPLGRDIARDIFQNWPQRSEVVI